MSVNLRLVIENHTIGGTLRLPAKALHLPQLPAAGELIRLADGSRVVVDHVMPSTDAGVDAEVYGTLSPATG